MTNLETVGPQELLPLLPYYVYTLIDPQSMQVFYVGKGTGTRAQQHLQEVDAMLSRQEELTNSKHLKIQEIYGRQHKPIELVIARFETEEEAFAVEATLIKWVFGFDNLTNAVQGHGCEYIREKDDYLERMDLDIQAPVRTTDGSFAKANIDNLRSLGAYALLELIQNRLTTEGFQTRDFSAKEDKPFAPGESNGWLGLLVRIKHIDFIVGFSKSCVPAISIANTEWSRSPKAHAQLESIYISKGQKFFTREPKNLTVKGQGRFRDFVVKPKFSQSSLDAMFTLLHELQAIDSPKRSSD